MSNPSTPPAAGTAGRTIADRLLDRLVALGVKHVFGVPGDYNLRFLDVLEARDDIEWVGMANELNAAYAADGYARLHGFAAIVTTYGVGELSAINGIAGSYAESVPVLQITGTPTTEVQDQGLIVHHGLLDPDSSHFHRAYDEVTCASAALRLESSSDEIDRVIATMWEQKRPGYLALPSDLVTEPASPSSAPARTRTPGDIAAFTVRAERMLRDAPGVVVLADHLADRHHATDAVNALIRAGHLASASVTSGKGIIDETTPGYLGLYVGALSEPFVRDAVESADVVIGAGLRLIDLSTGGFTAKIDPDRLIDLQPHHAVVGGERFDGVTIRAALAALGPVVATRPAAKFPAVGRPTAVDVAPGVSLTQDILWSRIGGFLRAGDVVAAEQGTSYYGLLGTPLPPGVDVIAQPMWSSIGYTLPGVFGAQLAAGPARRAILVIGDGSAALTVQELGTIARHGLAPIILLVNNDGYTVERAINGWNAKYNDIAQWDWARIPAAFGADPMIRKATTVGELDAALRECDAAAGRMAFIEAVLGKHDLPRLLAELAKAVAHRNS